LAPIGMAGLSPVRRFEAGEPMSSTSYWLRRLSRALFAALALSLLATGTATAADQVRIGYLGLEPAPRDPVSLLDLEIVDAGVQGARLAIEDNNTTGRFVNQEFVLEETVVPRDGDVVAAFRELTGDGIDLVVSALPRERLLEVVALPEAAEVTLFNVKARDDVLRNDECAANLFHTIPSRAMITDALAQFLSFKRWQRWALVVGNTPEDQLFAEAVRNSATKFGATLVGEKQWPHTPLARRVEGGFHRIQREVPVFLQDLPDHDILIVADETDYFGEYFPHQTWIPRPVAGTQGLTPTAWHRAHESWGAVQIQRRFEEQAGRSMTEPDFAAWIAVRAIGEAATRTQSVEPDAVVSYLLSEDFALGAYLGEPVTFRSWDHQLRLPVLVAGPRMIVSVSPQEGFLHPRTPLDSLGHDQPETRCRLG
jgi:ABC transporter substrate binding protein (PQQ-dependent alcohol dehydrogenase system)